MSAQLGPGVRVWIGWAPTFRVFDYPKRGDPRCRPGVIVAGPYVGEVHVLWDVQIETLGMWTCAEKVLFPIDDGDDGVLSKRHRHEPVDA